MRSVQSIFWSCWTDLLYPYQAYQKIRNVLKKVTHKRCHRLYGHIHYRKYCHHYLKHIENLYLYVWVSQPLCSIQYPFLLQYGLTAGLVMSLAVKYYVDCITFFVKKTFILHIGFDLRERSATCDYSESFTNGLQDKTWHYNISRTIWWQTYRIFNEMCNQCYISFLLYTQFTWHQGQRYSSM